MNMHKHSAEEYYKEAYGRTLEIERKLLLQLSDVAALHASIIEQGRKVLNATSEIGMSHADFIEWVIGEVGGKMRVGISVYCNTCGNRKCPRGRSAPMTMPMCDFECSGYYEEPKVGDLWPGETEEEFGYPVGADGTREAVPESIDFAGGKG